MENDKQVRFAQAGTEVWIGDVKADAKEGSQVYKTLSKPLFEDARRTFEQKEVPTVPLDMEFTLKIGQPAKLKATDSEGNFINLISDTVAEKAINKVLSNERIREQLEKTGGTPYYLRNLSIDTDNKSTMPISALNAMRREALEGIKTLRIKPQKVCSSVIDNTVEQWSAPIYKHEKVCQHSFMRYLIQLMS